MKQTKKTSKTTAVHTGEKAVVYHIDIEAGKFLVIYYIDLDDCEVYWRNDIALVAAHTEEYSKALAAADKKYSSDAYGFKTYH